MLDFTIIESGEDFEMLCEDLLKSMGFIITRRFSRGSDQGADLIVQKKYEDALGYVDSLRIMVECKHYAKSNRSVREDQIGNIIERTLSHNCNRYLLITSTLPSTSVRNQLENITNNPVIGISAAFWAKNNLSSYIEKFPDLIDKYFSIPQKENSNIIVIDAPKINVCVHSHPDFAEELNEAFKIWNSCQSHAFFSLVKPSQETERILLSHGKIDDSEAASIANIIREESGFTIDDGIILFSEKRLYSKEYHQLFTSGTRHFESPPNTAMISLKIMRELADGFNNQKKSKSIYCDNLVLSMLLLTIIEVITEGVGLQAHTEIRDCIMDFDDNTADILSAVETGPHFCTYCEKQLIRIGSDFLIKIAEATKDYLGTIKPSNSIKHKLDQREGIRKIYGDDYTYDVALSFAGEDRQLAEKLANELIAMNIRVFYDKYEQAKLWGQDLYAYLSELYRLRSRFCIMLISKYYSEKLWTNHERKSAQERAFNENRPYILPIKIDDTDVPGILSTIGYLHLKENTIEDIAQIIKEKIELS
jgi:hypothetical protein